jgi:hypothetical protein
MNRRRLLHLGAGTALALACTAGAVAWLQPAASPPATLDGPARAMFAALADVLLDGSLPTDPGARRAAIDQHLMRVQQTVHGLPPHARAELAQLITLLDTRAGRWVLLGLAAAWPSMPPAELARALSSMRRSAFSLRRQVYMALRELTMASFFADPVTWRQLSYPGPMAI